MAHERAQRTAELLDVTFQAVHGMARLTARGDQRFRDHQGAIDLISDRGSRCIKIEQPSMLEQRLLLHGTIESPLVQKAFDVFDGFARRIVYLENDLLDL